MNLLAIDPSLSCWGIAIPGAVTSWKPHSRGVERLDGATRHLERLVATHEPALVVLEGYSYASAQKAHQIGEMGGVLRLHLHRLGMPFIEVPPSSLKKWATGRGNAGKEEVLAEAIRRLGYDGHSNDEADALWLLHMAGSAYGLPWAATVPKSHQAGVQPTWPQVVRRAA